MRSRAGQSRAGQSRAGQNWAAAEQVRCVVVRDCGLRVGRRCQGSVE